VRAVGRTDLWRRPDFLKLWAGQTVSLLESQVSLLALPLTAILTLKASATQMGVLQAVEYLPWLLVTLFAGVWIDRVRRRPILIGADLGRALVLATIPVAGFLHVLRINDLYVVAFLVGLCTVFFSVAYNAFLPSLVPREQLIEGNGKLSTSQSLAAIAGPSLGGVLIQLVTAPLAITVDAASFVVSVLSLALIRTPETASVPPIQRHSVWRDIGDGLRLVRDTPLQRAVVGSAATFNLCLSIANAVYLLYVTRTLHVAPGVLGVIYAAGGPGGLLGALATARLTRRCGVGATILGAIILLSAAQLVAPLAGGSPVVVASLLIVAGFVGGGAGVAYDIGTVSVQQAITPEHLRGRMNASTRFILVGIVPVGFLVGGALGQAIGLRPTLLVGSVGTALAILWVVFSPLRTLRDALSDADGGAADRATPDTINQSKEGV